MLHVLEQKLLESWPPGDWADVTVVVAVSGGCDSVGLLRAMVAVRRLGAGRLVAAHLNHQLRAEADADRQFVGELCGRLGILCELGHTTIDPRKINDGIEAAARAARYEFLERTAERLGARFVATAHTADDQAETILHRIVRGTGIRGLAGIRRARPLGHATLIRPFLGVRRAEIEQYLRALGQTYCHDASNDDRCFTRNRLRHETIPHLRKHYNREASEALLRLAALAGEVQAVVDRVVEQQIDRSVVVEGHEAVHVVLAPLAGESRYIIRELLMAIWRRQHWPMQSMRADKWDELAEMAVAASECARRMFPGGLVVEVGQGRMRLSRRS
jgi:tRNA(Ile)-lysidine synthase